MLFSHSQIRARIRALVCALCAVLSLESAAQQQELALLEKRLFSIAADDTTQMARIGNEIVSKTTSEAQKFKVLQKIAESYFRANSVARSVHYSFKAKEVAERIGSPELLAQAYGSIANQYSFLDLTGKARNYLNLAMGQIELLPKGDKQSRLMALAQLEQGNLDFNEKDFASANEQYRASLRLFNQIADVKNRPAYHYRRSFYNIGNSYYYLKEADSSEKYLTRALAITDVENPALRYYIYSTLAEVYALRGDHRRAIDTLRAMLNDRGFNIRPLKMEVYLNLARNYEKIGDRNHYTRFNEMHLALRDTVEGQARHAIGTAINAEQQDLSASVSQWRQYNKWLVLGLVVLGVIGIGLVVWLLRRKYVQHTHYLAVIDELRSDRTQTRDQVTVEPKANLSVPSAVAAEIIGGLREFEQREEFRNPKLNLSMLALMLKTNPAYLSAVIKMDKDQNFNYYINNLRIRYICRKIHMHRQYAHYKISYLAGDCGFSSHSAFSTVFKKVTGISPSAFLAEAQKRHESQSVEPL